jgi:hypothetical protein
VAAIEQPLAAALAERTGGSDELTDQVLAAAVAAAARVAAEHWLTGWRPTSDAPTALVVPGASLAALLRAALKRVAPALAAADR